MVKSMRSHIRRKRIRYLAVLLGAVSLSLFYLGIKFMFIGAIDSSFGMFSGGFGMISLSFIAVAAMSKLFVEKKK